MVSRLTVTATRRRGRLIMTATRRRGNVIVIFERIIMYFQYTKKCFLI